MNKVDLIRRRLLQVFSIAFTVVAIYIISIIIFKVNDGRIMQFVIGQVTPIKVIGGIIVELILFSIIMKLVFRVSEKQIKRLVVLNMCIVAILCVIFGFVFITNPQWDFGSVFRGAADRVMGKEGRYLPGYFYRMYPNNIFITVLLFWFYKGLSLFGLHSFNKVSVALNIGLIMIGVVATYYLIKNIYGMKVAYISSFFFIFLTPMYAYAPIFYTDTFTLMYLPIIYLLFRKFTIDNSIWCLIVMGILGGIGVGIKNNIVIGIIALGIFAILTMKNWKKLIKFFVIFGVTFAIVISIISGICQYFIPVPMGEAGFPATHWLMMGLNTETTGAWDSKDYHATLALAPNKKAMEKMNIKVIKERLDDFGTVGYLEFLNKKATFTWQSGDLFAVNMLPLGSKAVHKSLYKYVLGDKNGEFLLFSQVGFAVLFIFVILGSITSIKDKKMPNVLFNIAIVGLFLFLLMWEAEPRYVLCLLPIIIASASSGINRTYKWINKDKWINKERI